MPRFDQTWRPAAMTRSTIRTMSIETGGKRNDEQRSHVPSPAGVCRRHAGDHPKLRHASCDNARVLLHMLEVIELIGREAKSPEAHRLLLEHACLIEAESGVGDLIEQDRQAIQLRGQALRVKLADTT